MPHGGTTTLEATLCAKHTSMLQFGRYGRLHLHLCTCSSCMIRPSVCISIHTHQWAFSMPVYRNKIILKTNFYFFACEKRWGCSSNAVRFIFLNEFVLFVVNMPIEYNVPNSCFKKGLRLRGFRHNPQRKLLKHRRKWRAWKLSDFDCFLLFPSILILRFGFSVKRNRSCEWTLKGKVGLFQQIF